MNDWTPTQIKEMIGDEIEAERRLRDALRRADKEALDSYKSDTAKALELAKQSADRMINLLMSVAALIISLATAAFVYVRH